MPWLHASPGRRALATTALVAICAAQAAAQTPWREAVTVTAAAEPLTFDAQSRVVYVVTRDQIARLPAPSWLLAATSFVRFERDVIDWVREVPQDRWRTANIREVTTRGVELSARRLLAGSMVDMQYAWLDSAAPTLHLLSKYVLDVARHRLAASGSATLPGRLVFGGRLGITRRLDGREYTLLDARLSRRWGALWLTADFKNLLNEDYEEIVGVAMPGRNGRIEIAWRK